MYCRVLVKFPWPTPPNPPHFPLYLDHSTKLGQLNQIFLKCRRRTTDVYLALFRLLALVARQTKFGEVNDEVLHSLLVLFSLRVLVPTKRSVWIPASCLRWTERRDGNVLEFSDRVGFQRSYLKRGGSMRIAFGLTVTRDTRDLLLRVPSNNNTAS